MSFVAGREAPGEADASKISRLVGGSAYTPGMSSPGDAASFPASLAGRFEYEAVLGSGSFGTVYRAVDRELGRAVAIKLLRTTQGDAVARLRREAEVLEGLRHPGVVAFYDHGEVPEGAYLVLELIEGRSFAEVPPIRPLAAMKLVAEALEAVHQAGTVHRDVKPENLIATPEGRVVLVDFGLVRDPNRTSATATGHLVGTPAYMAPEVLRGSPAGPAADWYGWGVCLYHLLEARLPYEAKEIHAMIRGEDPGPPPFQDPGSEAARYAAAALLPDPATRMAAVTEVGMASSAKVRLRPTAGVPAPRLADPDPEDYKGISTAAMAPEREPGAPLASLVSRVVAGLVSVALVGWLALGRGEEPGALATQSAAVRPELEALRAAVDRLTRDHRREDGTFGNAVRDSTPDDHMVEIRAEFADGRIVSRTRRVLERLRAYLDVAEPEEAARAIEGDIGDALGHMAKDEDLVLTDLFSPKMLGRPTGLDGQVPRSATEPLWAGVRDVPQLRSRIEELRATRAGFRDLARAVPGVGGAQARAWILNLATGEVRAQEVRRLLEVASVSPPRVRMRLAFLSTLVGAHSLDVGEYNIPCELMGESLDSLEAALMVEAEVPPEHRAEIGAVLALDGLGFLMSCAKDPQPRRVAQIYRGIEALEAVLAEPGGQDAGSRSALWSIQAVALTPDLGGVLLLPGSKDLSDAFARATRATDGMRVHVGAAPLAAYTITTHALDTLLGDSAR